MFCGIFVSPVDSSSKDGRYHRPNAVHWTGDKAEVVVRIGRATLKGPDKQVLNDLAVGLMTARLVDVSVRLYTDGDQRRVSRPMLQGKTGGAADWMYRVRGAPTDPRPGLTNLLWRNQLWSEVNTPAQDDEDLSPGPQSTGK